MGSLSARRAWIEISHPSSQKSAQWSLSARRAWIEILVTTHVNFCDQSLSARRAWIEMSITPEMGGGWGRSLSARRAWIEIVMPFFAVFEAQVALRKESVDRNASARLILTSALWSLSARRAWIEILVTTHA